jgi:enamine deaminase RidA (YjgF/YER057c/UK114 family)
MRQSGARRQAGVQRGEDEMTGSWKAVFFGTGLMLCASAAGAQPVTRLGLDSPTVSISQAVTVPPGYTTFYISGTPAAPADPKAPVGSPQRWGATPDQTASSLNLLEATLTKLGLSFGDVVKATVFLTGDPAKNGELDFAGMNREWAKRFGTAAQPNKPARSTVKVAGLATPGAIVEIEMVAVKKLP